MTSNQSGFTIVEIMAAVMLLTVGVLALASTSGMVTRMIGQGKRYSQASVLASERLDVLRGTDCSALADGSETRDGFDIAWRIASAAGGEGRTLQVAVTSPTTDGSRTDVFTSTISCRI